MKLITTIMFVLLITVTSVLASGDTVNRSGYVGISTAIQSNQLDIMVPIWGGQSFVFIPTLSYVNISGSQSDFGLGATLRFNFYSKELVPYLGFRIGMLQFTPDGGSGITDMFYGSALGGEYFLKEKLSVGIEAQINITNSHENSTRFGNPDGTTLNTASKIYATIYF